MPAAAHRLTGADRRARTGVPSPKPHFATADDTSLLGALPIAAAIVELHDDDSLVIAAHNSRFFETVRDSTCIANDWNEADCLKSGPISDLIHRFFAGTDVTGELDFKDGDGVSRSEE